MQYRTLPQQPDTPLPILGLSCMRLPRLEDGTPDEAAIAALVSAAMTAGVTCFDTGMSSRDNGLEPLGRALAAFPRENFRLLVGIPAADVRRPEDLDKFLEDRLRRLGVGYIDMFTLHIPGRDVWERNVMRNGLLKRLNQIKKSGKVRAVGFSLYDDPAVFRRVLTGFDGWDLCRVALNYLGAGKNALDADCLALAAERKVGVMVTDPLPDRGGELPARVTDLLPTDRTPAEWALDWLWSRPEVCSLMVNAADPADLPAFAAMADRAAVGMVSKEEAAQLTAARELFRRAPLVDCTGCNYCMPCLIGVPIPRIYEIYNRSATDMRGARRQYAELDIKAEDCLTCGACARLCPQKNDGPTLMPQIAALLGERE